MRYFKLFLFILFTSFLFILISPVKAAEKINSFDVTLTPSQNGQIKVEEDIVYDFDNLQKHGIFRDIPLLSKVGDLYKLLKFNLVSVSIDDEWVSYSITYSDNNVDIKIGNPNQTITGVHKYTIIYNISNEIVNFPDHDEINWNVNGTNWPVPVNAISAKINSSFPITNSTCYTGSQGSKDQNCKVISSNPLNITAGPLLAGQNLTIVAAFAQNTFTAAQLSTEKPNVITSLSKSTQIILAIAALIYYLFLPLLILIYYLTHHHKSRLGPVTVNFDLPKDLNGDRLPPAEAGAVDNAQIEKDDLIATIYDFAIRKIIVIKQTKTDGKLLGLIPSSTTYTLNKLTDLPDTSTPYEIALFNFLFEDGAIFEINKLSKNFYTTFETFSELVFKSLVSRGIYLRDPRNRKAMFIGLGIISLVTLNLFLGGLFFYFAFVLLGRTAKGEELDWKIDGLKLFLKNMSREFKWQADQLILVEKMIPYAIALGYIDKLMEAIKIHYPNYKPSWYIGPNPYFLVHTQMFNSFSQSMVTRAPSSSSGFSGGGFSGGGGGGGGGGSW